MRLQPRVVWASALTGFVEPAADELVHDCSHCLVCPVCVVVSVLVRREDGGREVEHTLIEVWHRVGAAVVIPLLLAAVALEALLGYGLAHFLDRVRPDLLPTPATGAAAGPAPSPSTP